MNPLTVWLAATALEFREGRCRLRKGKVPQHQLTALEDLLGEAGIERAHVTRNGLGRCSFSRSIPAHLHQRIRNVLAS